MKKNRIANNRTVGQRIPNSKKKGANTLRIIGGEWRSRKLQFLDAPGLRPTPDRIRETLFNWLQGEIHGANCLDMFAGSGILGLEALSRGARTVDFVEKNTAASDQLRTNLDILNNQSTVFQNDALDFLGKHLALQAYDIIFLDPPYRQGLLKKSLRLLTDKGLIGPQSLVYIEHESEKTFDFTEFGIEVFKNAYAGQVQSCLLKTT